MRACGWWVIQHISLIHISCGWGLPIVAFIPTGQNKLMSFKINNSHLVDHQIDVMCSTHVLLSCHVLLLFFFFNKAVINCHCALSWCGPKLAEINSACQRAVLWRNKAKRLTVRKPLGGSICNALTLFRPGFLPGDMRLFSERHKYENTEIILQNFKRRPSKGRNRFLCSGAMTMSQTLLCDITLVPSAH